MASGFLHLSDAKGFARKIQSMAAILGISALICWLPFSCLAQATDTTIYTRVEEMPRYNGCRSDSLRDWHKEPCGERDLLKLLFDNIRIRPLMLDEGWYGKLIIKFVVEKDGSVSNVEMVNSVPTEVEAHVVQVIQSMQPWLPGKHEGKPVRVRFLLPVTLCFR